MQERERANLMQERHRAKCMEGPEHRAHQIRLDVQRQLDRSEEGSVQTGASEEVFCAWTAGGLLPEHAGHRKER